MRRSIHVLGFVLSLQWAVGRVSAAAPADCPTGPAATSTMPLALNLRGLPGVPAGIGGYVGIDVPVPLPDAMACEAPEQTDQFEDVLQGPPGDVLLGAGRGDVLSGRRAPRVEIEVR